MKSNHNKNTTRSTRSSRSSARSAAAAAAVSTHKRTTTESQQKQDESSSPQQRNTRRSGRSSRSASLSNPITTTTATSTSTNAASITTTTTTTTTSNDVATTTESKGSSRRSSQPKTTTTTTARPSRTSHNNNTLAATTTHPVGLTAMLPDSTVVVRVSIYIQSALYTPPLPLSSTSPIRIGHDGNQFACQVCGEGGNVVCCDGCPLVYHASCLSLAAKNNNDIIPSLDTTDPWFCPACCCRKDTTTTTTGTTTTTTTPPPTSSSPASASTKKHKRTASSKASSGSNLPSADNNSAGPKSVEKKKRKTTKQQATPSTHKAQRRGSSTADASTVGSSPPSNNNNATVAVVQAQSAFLFYLHDNRWKIEKSLLRGHRTFQRLPKGNERNALIAQEALQCWTKLEDHEKTPYIDMAIQDYEQRIRQWKEERDQVSQAHGAMEGADEDVVVPTTHMTNMTTTTPAALYAMHDRLYQQTSVGSKAFKPEPDQSYNRVVLDLLHDTRFHPLPLFTTHRPEQDASTLTTSAATTTNNNDAEATKLTIPYFDVHGPIATSLGDECLGCSRGWNHFCPVLQRRLPAMEHRARLQPPVSSLLATRVGLGLRPRVPPQALSIPRTVLEWRPSREAQEIMELPIVPSSTASNPSERVDEIVQFIEETVAMKIPEPPKPPPPSSLSSSSRKNAVTQHRTLPIMGTTANDAHVHLKCGRCRTIILSETGCVQCRRAQLVINKSKQPPLSGTGAKLKVQTTMLGRITIKDRQQQHSQEYGAASSSSLSSAPAQQPPSVAAASDQRWSESLLKERWCPSAILPPRPVLAPRPKAEGDDDEQVSSSSEASSSSSETSEDEAEGNEDEEDIKPSANEVNGKMDNGKRSATSHDSDVEMKQEANDVAQQEGVSASAHTKNGDTSVTEPVPMNDEESTNTDDTEEVSLRPRKRTRPQRLTIAPAQETPVQRDFELKRRQKEAAEVQKKALQIACYCMFLALIRRDPLHLFASPAQAEGYAEMIKNPIDFSMIRDDVLAGKYSSIGSFCSDVRLLCENALAFNAPNSIYYKTAEEMHHLVATMQKRSANWIGAIKDAYTAYLSRQGSKKRRPNPVKDDEEQDAENPSDEGEVDPLDELRNVWPEAACMFEKGDDFRTMLESDFMRTKENEIAYYGSIAVCRAAAAAEACLAPYPDSGSHHAIVSKRKHYDDEALRKKVDEKAASVPLPQLKVVSSWREESVVRLAKKVQKARLEKKTISEHGCSRCEPIDKTSLKPINDQPVRVRKKEQDGSRVAASRLRFSTGLGSANTRERVEARAEQSYEEQIGSVGDACVSVRGSRVHGMGLFADQTFRKGEVVAEYRGEYVTNALADKRERHYRDQRIQDYQFRSSDMIVDATMKGGAARYINHNCSPNCVAKIIAHKDDPKLKRLIIIAQRNIELNEEISYDYQFPLEVDLQARVPCNCGSDQCRGFMNWDLPEKGSNNRALLVQKRGANIRDRIRRFGRPLKRDES